VAARRYTERGAAGFATTAILNAQSYILAELAGTQYKVMRLYTRIPGIALRVGLDALKVLERSPAVTNVLLDRPARASR
jgi:hypothetical protein